MSSNKKVQRKVIDFGSLDDQNKTQFLQFLLKNNIEFQKGSSNDADDYVAKVTLKKNNPKTISPLHSKDNQTHNKSKTNRTPIKTENKKSVRAQKNKENQVNKPNNKKNKQYSTPLKENALVTNSIQKVIDKPATLCKKSPTPKNNPKSPLLKQEKTKNNPKSDNKMNCSIKTGEFIPNYYRAENYQYSGTPRATTSKHIKKQKKVEAPKNHTQLKRKTQLQKQQSYLFSKYVKLFQLKIAGHRTAKWPLSQLCKAIEDIYNQLLRRNHLSCISNKKKPQNTGIHKLIKQHLTHKHKNQKIGISNLLNLLYSLASHQLEIREVLKNQGDFHFDNKSTLQLHVNRISRTILNIFDNFISGVYLEEDLWFFLFIRNVVRRFQQKSIQTQLNNRSINGPRLEQLSESTILNQTMTYSHEDHIYFSLKKDCCKILENIFAGEPELINKYYSLIIKKKSESGDDLDKTHPIQMLKILVDDYSQKRAMKLQQSNQQCQPINKYEQSEPSLQMEPSLQLEPFCPKSTYQVDNAPIYGIPSVQDLHKPLFIQEESLFADDLTFGDETKEEDKLYRELDLHEKQQEQDDEQEGFWKIINTSIYNNVLSYGWEQNKSGIEFSQLSQSISGGSAQRLLVEKMKKKVSQLISIIVQSQSYYNSKKQNKQINKNGTCYFNSQQLSNKDFLKVYNLRDLRNATADLLSKQKEQQNQFIDEFCDLDKHYRKRQQTKLQKKDFEEIILRKCLTLLGCIFQMDKIKWFEELGIHGRECDQDMILVEKLQIMYRKLKRQPDMRAVGQLCKAIITIQYITQALQNIFVQ